MHQNVDLLAFSAKLLFHQGLRNLLGLYLWNERRNRRTRRRLRDRKPKHLRPRRAKCFDTGRTTQNLRSA
jgi:hypothetical protein